MTEHGIGLAMSRVMQEQQDLRGMQRDLVGLLPELRARALRLTASQAQAEDIVQDTVERALRFAHQFDPDTHLRAWVHTILFTVFVSRCRSLRRERRALERYFADPCVRDAPPAEPSLSALSPAVDRALDALPIGFRDAVAWVDLEGLSYRDAADRARVPVGTIMSRLHRGRRMLANTLGGGRVRVSEQAPANPGGDRTPASVEPAGTHPVRHVSMPRKTPPAAGTPPRVAA